MAVLVDTDTRLCVSGITGREGTFHALNNRNYGTQVVSGVTPGKGGQDVEGIPVFNTFHDAVAETGANTAMVFVPPRFAADSILEAEDAGMRLIVAITEGIPAHDELRVYNHLARNDEVTLIGPNCPGILSPGKANVGIIPASFFKEGNVGVVSRSGTLTYQIGNELAQRGFGNSSIVGNRRRSRARLLVHRHHRPLRGRPADRADRHERRDRRLGGGGGGRVHRRERLQARSSPTSPGSPRRRARRWATRARSSQASPAPRPARPPRSRGRASAWGGPRPRSPRSPRRSPPRWPDRPGGRSVGGRRHGGPRPVRRKRPGSRSAAAATCAAAEGGFGSELRSERNKSVAIR
jgi:hypothetical protein